MLSCTCTPLIWLATASYTRTCLLLLLDSWNNAQKDQKDHHFVSFFLTALECFYSVWVQLLCIAPMSSLPCHAMPCQYKSLHYKLNCYCFELFSYDTCPALRKSFIWHGSLLKIPPDHYVNETDISPVVEYLWGLSCLSRKRTYR